MIRRLCASAVSTLLACSSAVAQNDDGSGLGSAGEAMAKLVPLTLDGSRLAIDRDHWKKLQTPEPRDPDELKKYRREKIAKAMRRPADKLTDAEVEQWWPHYGNKPIPEEAFHEVANKCGGGWAGGGSSSSRSGASFSVTEERARLSAHLTMAESGDVFRLRLVEKTEAGRLLEVDDDPRLGLTVRYGSAKGDALLMLRQAKGGRVQVVVFDEGEPRAASAPDFAELLRTKPELIEGTVFKRLAEVGIRPPLTRWSHEVMAQAVAGFSDPGPELRQRLDAVVKRLIDDDPEVREKATTELDRLYPAMVASVRALAESAGDAEVRSRAKLVIEGHPDIDKVRNYVLAVKLHEDRAYLLQVMTDKPDFRAAARRRLTALYGKDHGDDPKAWPKPDGSK